MPFALSYFKKATFSRKKINPYKIKEFHGLSCFGTETCLHISGKHLKRFVLDKIWKKETANKNSNLDALFESMEDGSFRETLIPCATCYKKDADFAKW
ncbi:hypothetical protein CEXT_776441 [Caerostris extrusa]|uniref:4Fe4S-binding SPASM domain-containing protein n=1 Tax=Caerostris extrusa TaxID=172846 RepID=A0AAV4P7P3_CAEEX|nr:hypothetical protein CEXT_776441 [Caerostris extrusa]